MRTALRRSTTSSERWRRRERALSRSGALQPDELAALGARVCHAQVAFERDEAALSVTGARRTDGRGFRLDRGHLQQTARGRARNGGRAAVMPPKTRSAVRTGREEEQSVEN